MAPEQGNKYSGTYMQIPQGPNARHKPEYGGFLARPVFGTLSMGDLPGHLEAAYKIAIADAESMKKLDEITTALKTLISATEQVYILSDVLFVESMTCTDNYVQISDIRVALNRGSILSQELKEILDECSVGVFMEKLPHGLPSAWVHDTQTWGKLEEFLNMLLEQWTNRLMDKVTDYNRTTPTVIQDVEKHL